VIVYEQDDYISFLGEYLAALTLGGKASTLCWPLTNILCKS